MLVDLKLDNSYCGLLYLAEPALQRIQSHHHVELELNLVIQGTITYVIGGRRYTFSPRTLLWLLPGQEHQLVDRAVNSRFYVAVFKPSLIDESCHSSEYEILKAEDGRESTVMSTTLEPRYFDLISRIMATLMEGSLDSDLLNREAGFGASSTFRFEHRDPDALNAGLRYLLLLCWKAHTTGVANQSAVSLHPAVRRALKILSEADRGQNLREIASTCGTSAPYLSRLFHRQIGIPLSKYRNSLRLTRFFHEYYRSTSRKTVTEIMYSVGFGSYAQFYKLFIQAYGRGPRECLKPNSDRLAHPNSQS